MSTGRAYFSDHRNFDKHYFGHSWLRENKIARCASNQKLTAHYIPEHFKPMVLVEATRDILFTLEIRSNVKYKFTPDIEYLTEYFFGCNI